MTRILIFYQSRIPDLGIKITLDLGIWTRLFRYGADVTNLCEFRMEGEEMMPQPTAPQSVLLHLHNMLPYIMINRVPRIPILLEYRTMDFRIREGKNYSEKKTVFLVWENWMFPPKGWRPLLKSSMEKKLGTCTGTVTYPQVPTYSFFEFFQLKIVQYFVIKNPFKDLSESRIRIQIP